jgi:hypothetical protein
MRIVYIPGRQRTFVFEQVQSISYNPYWTSFLTEQYHPPCVFSVYHGYTTYIYI